MRTILLVAVLAIAGCKGKDKAPEPAKTTEPAKTEPAKTEPPKGAKVLDLAPAKMLAEGEGQKAELSVDAAGTVLLDGKQAGALSPAGELTVDGKVVATIAADGKMSIVGESEHVTIRADGGMLDKDGQLALELRPDGTFGGPLAETELKGLKLKIEGDKAGYRALMFAWLGVSKASK